MAIYTPRGLKIRLPVESAFALMARLYPRVRPSRVLLRTEEVENFGGMLAFISGTVAFLLGLNTWTIAAVAWIVPFSVSALHWSKWFIPTFLVFSPIAKIFNLLAGRGLFVFGLAALGYFTVGWLGTVAYFAGRIAAEFSGGALNLIRGRRSFVKTGFAATASERSFFHAYSIESILLDRSPALDLTAAELEQDNWLPCFGDFMIEHPRVASLCDGEGL